MNNTNKEYQEINQVFKRTASSDLKELVDTFELFENIGVGAGSYYKLIGHQLGINWAIGAIQIYAGEISACYIPPKCPN